MDDGLDDELLASQPLQKMLVPPEERSVPNTASVPRSTDQWSARVGRQTGAITPHISERLSNPGAPVVTAQSRQCGSDTARSSCQHTPQDSLSLGANTLTTSSVSQARGHSETPALPFLDQTRQAPLGAKPSRKVSPWKIETSPTIGSHVISDPKKLECVVPEFRHGRIKLDTLGGAGSYPSHTKLVLTTFFRMGSNCVQIT